MLYRAAAALYALIALLSTTEASARPNIVMILVDDLDKVITEPYFEEILPNAMALKKEGVEFTNAFVTTPQCCPSRAAILSGKYGHNTRVLGNGGRNGGYHVFVDDEPETIAAHLYLSGYRTLMSGKYLNGFKKDHALPWGWTDGNVLVSPNLRKYRGYNYELLNWRDGKPATRTRWTAPTSVEEHGEKEQDYSTDVVLKRTLEFLEDAKSREDARPFFAYVAPTCPHFPIPPAKRHLKAAAERWGLDTFPKNRPNYFADGATHEDKPQWLTKSWNKRSRLIDYGGKLLAAMGGEIPENAPSGMLGWNEVDWFNRMGSLMACDEMVRDLVGWLKTNGEWENTVLVFTSDNGYNLGSHALAQKSSPYEEALRVPLIIAGGAATGIRRGGKDGRWFLNIDFAPTFLELAGAPVPAAMDGESAVTMLRGTANERGRDQMLIEYSGPSIAEGYLEDFFTYHLRIAPAFFLDMPTYQAIRAKRGGREYLLVRWERQLSQRLFNRRLRKERKLLMSRLERGRPLAMRKLEESRRRDFELYDISADPHELDNLLYYAPEAYGDLADEIETELDRLLDCKGTGSERSCRDAARL